MLGTEDTINYYNFNIYFFLSVIMIIKQRENREFNYNEI